MTTIHIIQKCDTVLEITAPTKHTCLTKYFTYMLCDLTTMRYYYNNNVDCMNELTHDLVQLKPVNANVYKAYY